MNDDITELSGIIEQCLKSLDALENENRNLRRRLKLDTGVIAAINTTPPALVVSADDDAKLELRKLLAGIGCIVQEAVDLASAEALCAEKQFHLVLVETRVGDEDGLTILKSLRRQTESELLIVVDFSSADAAVDALRAGANGFLIRPVEADVAGAQLEESLQQFRLKHQNRQAFASLRDRHQVVLDRIAGRK